MNDPLGKAPFALDKTAEPRQGWLARPADWTRNEVIAGLLSLVWVLAIGAYFLSGAPNGGSFGVVLTLLVVFLPLALIWTAVITLRSVTALRAEAAQLQAAVEAMRAAYVAAGPGNGGGLKPQIERRIEEIAHSAKATEAALTGFASRRDAGMSVPSADRKAALVAPSPPPPETEQPGLALGTPAEALRPPLPLGDLIRALQFPDSADDKEGFRCLRAALEDRGHAKLIRAAQDVLTLLAQEGIFMDDLKPDRTRPELWRRFAEGERGRAIAGLGGVRDRSSLALAAGRMREDPVFRDAAHHFLRSFDKLVSQIAAEARDGDFIALSETRTARAFMLFGRITGTFD